MQEVIMPKLGLTMEKGRIVKWLKKEGDRVRRDEPLVEIETEKVTMALESTGEGVLARIIAREGQEVPVSQAIAILTSEGETPPPLKESTIEVRQHEVAPLTTTPTAVAREEFVKVSPLARKIAEEHGIDVSKLKGTGPGGRIVKEDVLGAVEEARRTPAAKIPMVVLTSRTEPLTGLRKTIAERMTVSSQTIPQVTLQTEVDITETVNFHEGYVVEMERAARVHVTFTDIVVKATAKALREYPRLNAMFDHDAIRINEAINVGVAVAVDNGLIVPVVHNADKKSLLEIAKVTKELAEKARDGKLTMDEVSNGTFTISNLGMYGVDAFTPLINPPQSGILGVGRITKKPAVMDGQIVIRSVMPLSLTFDHRVTDGTEAAKFLGRIKNLLEHPSRVFLES